MARILAVQQEGFDLPGSFVLTCEIGHTTYHMYDVILVGGAVIKEES
jgi:hypothetical protein